MGRIPSTSGSLRSLIFLKVLSYYLSYLSVLVAFAERLINLYLIRISYSRA
jgi:hypothetical protein